ncbi:hypothetical protein MMC14_002169 [Varicellaria rhodocarpa]|nr:hypothetical protein [Varicellaria rhodocarpa]
MQIITTLAIALLALVPSTVVASASSPPPLGLNRRAPTPSPPALTYLFSVTLNIGNATKPIPIPGGVRIGEHPLTLFLFFYPVEPLLSGTITGPAVNGTIEGGLAYPPVLYNQTLQVPQINIYGTTSDGYPFFASEMGVGSPSDQITRLQLDIAGPYLYLSKAFIIGDVVASADRTVVKVTGFQIG